MRSLFMRSPMMRSPIMRSPIMRSPIMKSHMRSLCMRSLIMWLLIMELLIMWLLILGLLIIILLIMGFFQKRPQLQETHYKINSEIAEIWLKIQAQCRFRSHRHSTNTTTVKLESDRSMCPRKLEQSVFSPPTYQPLAASHQVITFVYTFL